MLLHNVTNDFLWKVMHYINFVLLSVAWAGLAYLFLIAKSYIFGNFKGSFTPKVKIISLKLKEVPLAPHSQVFKQSNLCHLFKKGNSDMLL